MGGRRGASCSSSTGPRGHLCRRLGWSLLDRLVLHSKSVSPSKYMCVYLHCEPEHGAAQWSVPWSPQYWGTQVLLGHVLGVIFSMFFKGKTPMRKSIKFNEIQQWKTWNNKNRVLEICFLLFKCQVRTSPNLFASRNLWHSIASQELAVSLA